MRARWWLVALSLVPAEGARAQAVEEGTLSAVWGDPLERGRPGALFWMFHGASGTDRQVLIAPTVLEDAGGFFAVNARRVTLSAALRPAAPSVVGGALWEATRIRPLSTFAAPGAALGVAAVAQIGSKPYAVLMCKFADVAAEPTNVGTLTSVMSNSRPGMDHYWREASAGQMNIAGTTVFGWFTLPRPKASYFSGSSPNFALLATDCTTAAEAQVNFTQFSGVAAQFNANLTNDGTAGSAYGGSHFLTLDASARSWPFMWMPLWATETGRYGGYAHEMGHSLGLPHSSGPYAETYDSKWDVMSNAYLAFSGGYWVPGHTIAAHKDALGWIPSNRKQSISSGEQTLVLEQHETPTGTGNLLLVRIPISGSSSVYTLEARRLLGYDAGLPGEGVIMHRVTGACDNNSVVCARVVDVDGNGNPNDAAAMWVAGETFDDGAGVRVRVNSRTADGWNLTVTAVQQCTLTLAQTGGGTISLTSGTTTGECGRSVTVSAAPSSGYAFTSWSTGGSANPYTFTLNQNTTLSATFTLIPQCTVTLGQTTGGTIALTSGTLVGACGRSVAVTATPTPGYSFSSWSTGSTTNPLTLTITQSVSITATFVRQCTLTLTQTAGGTIALTAGTATGACDRSVTITATAAGDYAFRRWSTGSTANPLTATLSQDLTVSATFAAQCTLSLGQTTGGTIALSSGALTGDCGRSVTATATPSSGYAFIAWSDAGAESPRTVVVTTTTQMLSATFADLAGVAKRMTTALLASSTAGLAPGEAAYADAQGNKNGRLDLGDLLALLDRNPGIALAGPDLGAVVRSPAAARGLPVSNPTNRTNRTNRR